MVFIFFLYAQPTEQINKLSLNMTESIMSTEAAVDLDLTDPTNIIVQQNTAFRKIAHFVLFLVLGILLSFALKVFGIKGNWAYLVAVGICILYAFSDELHQSFVPGRNAQLVDVLIDAVGALAGIVMFGIMNKLARNSRLV